MYPYIYIGKEAISSISGMIVLGFVVAGIFLWYSFQQSTLTSKHKWLWMLITVASVATGILGTRIDEQTKAYSIIRIRK
jgi:hypothetical protein